jgi:glycosyltransferase involved in cell wall biosynthesis
MRVAVFTDTFLPQINGVTNTLKKLVEYFDNANIEYLIFAPDSYTEVDGDYNIQRFLSFKFFMYPECRFTLPNVQRIKNSLIQFKPDIIHIMTEFSMGVTGLSYGKKLGIPTVSNYTTNFAQYMKYYNLDILEGAAWNYMRWFHNQNDMTLCPSEETRRLLKNNGIHNTDIFSRGIDFNSFKPELRSSELRRNLGVENKIVLLYVGRVAPEKDIDVLYKAYIELKAQYKNCIELIITGDGPELSKYKKLFTDSTIFTGYKKGRELAEIYASSDIFVFPSPTETFGNVVLEAMASGLPVVVPNSGGVKDIVSDRVNGLLFKPGEYKDLEKKVTELLEEEDLSNYLRSNGRKTALQRSWNSICKDLIQIYNEMIYMRNQKRRIIS